MNAFYSDCSLNVLESNYFYAYLLIPNTYYPKYIYFLTDYYHAFSPKTSCSIYKKIYNKILTHLPSIFETHPLLTCSILEISQGLAPECANSTIFCLVLSGKGLPLT